jgi:hypothetical protein
MSLMSEVGPTRQWRHVRVESVLPPTSEIGRRGRHGRKVPKPAVSGRSKNLAYSITSSAVAIGGFNAIRFRIHQQTAGSL